MKRPATGWIVATALTVGLMLGGRYAGAGIVPEVLKDGTKIEIDGDKVYSLSDAQAARHSDKATDAKSKVTGDGSVKPQRTALKDGTYTLQNGKTIEIKNGKLLPAVQK